MVEETTASSFLEQFRESFCDRPEGAYSGDDLNGRYESIAALHRDGDADFILETRRYFYHGGRLRRVARILIELYGESLIRAEEWSEDRTRRRVTSYGDGSEWLWEKWLDTDAGRERLSVNRDAFIFRGVPEEYFRTLEDGEFNPDWLLQIHREGFREAVLEILGTEKVIPALPMVEIDRCGLNRLLRLSWKELTGSRHEEAWAFAELHCTTTGKISFLRVPPGTSDIMSAIAWTFGTDKENYQLEVET